MKGEKAMGRKRRTSDARAVVHWLGKSDPIADNSFVHSFIHPFINQLIMITKFAFKVALSATLTGLRLQTSTDPITSAVSLSRVKISS